jgi:hypothetical protein
LATGSDVEHHRFYIETSTKEPAERPGRKREVSNAMNIVERVRQRRQANRNTRAVNRAWQTAPTQAMRDEILILAQRRPF